MNVSLGGGRSRPRPRHTFYLPNSSILSFDGLRMVKFQVRGGNRAVGANLLILEFLL